MAQSDTRAETIAARATIALCSQASVPPDGCNSETTTPGMPWDYDLRPLNGRARITGPVTPRDCDLRRSLVDGARWPTGNVVSRVSASVSGATAHWALYFEAEAWREETNAATQVTSQ